MQFTYCRRMILSYCKLVTFTCTGHYVLNCMKVLSVLNILFSSLKQEAFLVTSRRPSDFPLKWLGDAPSDSSGTTSQVELAATAGEGDEAADSSRERAVLVAREPAHGDTAVEPASADAAIEVASADAAPAAVWCPSMLSADEAYPSRLASLVSATSPVIDDSDMPPRVVDFLGLRDKQASVEQVMTQAQHALMLEPRSLSDASYRRLQAIMSDIWQFLQERYRQDERLAEQLAQAFSRQPCVLIERQLLLPRLVSVQPPLQCQPYLHTVPPELSKFSTVLSLVGVKAHFDAADYVKALQRMRSDYLERPLDRRHVVMCKNMADRLCERMRAEKLTADVVEEKHGVIYMPNSSDVMHPASSLCHDDCPWLPHSQAMNFIHPG